MVTTDGICPWAVEPPENRRYHDEEWGVPVVDDVAILEKLCLEGFQAGLSWLTILRKRDAFRSAFAHFDPDAVAAFDEHDVERLMADAGIVRNRAKIESTINNARRALAVRDEHGSLAAYLWSYAPSEAPAPAPRATADLAATSPASTTLSRALKRQGWTFVGPTSAGGGVATGAAVGASGGGGTSAAAGPSPTTYTAMPDGVWSKKLGAAYMGIRTQPCDAGYGGIDGEPWMAIPP